MVSVGALGNRFRRKNFLGRAFERGEGCGKFRGYYWQVPLTQDSPVAQAWPQEPQFAGSVLRFLQAFEQHSSSVPQQVVPQILLPVRGQQVLLLGSIQTSELPQQFEPQALLTAQQALLTQT